jgi:hypothetical protein
VEARDDGWSFFGRERVRVATRRSDRWRGKTCDYPPMNATLTHSIGFLRKHVMSGLPMEKGLYSKILYLRE